MRVNKKNKNQHITLEPIDNDRLINLCGLLDKNIRQIESFFDVEISNRGNSFKITGGNENVASTSNFIEKIYDLSEKEEITPKQLHLYLNNSSEFLSANNESSKTDLNLKKNTINQNLIIKKSLLKPSKKIP